jgi:hypothetical protein
MPEINLDLSPKQKEAFEILFDDKTTELLYGGGAGGGKSYLGCAWLILMCLFYPGSRWLMGRAILKTLKESTLLTFFRICKDNGIKKGKHYNYNQIEGLIKFANGSEIYLKDLYAYPSDPEFDELGSTEFTGAFIDEASQITQKAYLIVMSRLRYKLDDFGLIPKLLIATNPTKNFLYSEFYKPYKDDKLQKYRKFVTALVQDNPYISKHYVDNLHKLDRISQERLLYGNWEYDDDPAKLFDYEAILDIFTNEPRQEKEERFLTVDVARYGSDNTVIIVWNGLFIEKIQNYQKQGLKETRQIIESICKEHQIMRHNVVVDEDGVGGGLVDEISGINGFVNNSKPREPLIKGLTANYSNLKSQCYFYLAEMVNAGKIGCSQIDPEIRNKIITDLEQIKRHKPDSDGKLQVTPKEIIKENIGRSPDFGDAMMMRMFFVLNKAYTPYIAK